MLTYDTLTKTKKKLRKKRLRLFVCGPTVYDYSHIGHARTYIAFDMYVKYLRHKGYKVKYLQNITDIDDKIINRAKEEGVSAKEIASRFEREYVQDMEALGIASVDKYARASDYVKQITAQIKKLEKGGFAYKTENGVYFRVKKFKNYGKLSGQKIEELKDLEKDPQKEDPLDFAIWKTSKEGEPSWPSPWGEGRPGWHIEDTAITKKEFGAQYELHGGARDLIFPHHEAEIALMESAYGKPPLVEYWLHTGFLQTGGEKMAKSLKNFVTIREVLKEYSPQTLRIFFTTKHYRSPIDYTGKSLEEARANEEKITNFWTDVLWGKEGDKKNTDAKEDEEKIQEFIKKFWDNLEDDFNTPAAFGEFFKLVNYFYEEKDLSPKGRDLIIAFLKNVNKVFGIIDEGKITNPDSVPNGVLELLIEREKARSEKDWEAADILRKTVERKGYIIEDRPDGPIVKRK